MGNFVAKISPNHNWLIVVMKCHFYISSLFGRDPSLILPFSTKSNNRWKKGKCPCRITLIKTNVSNAETITAANFATTTESTKIIRHKFSIISQISHYYIRFYGWIVCIRCSANNIKANWIEKMKIFACVQVVSSNMSCGKNKYFENAARREVESDNEWKKQKAIYVNAKTICIEMEQ